MTESAPLPAIDIHAEFPCSIKKAADGRLQLSIDLRNSENSVFADSLYRFCRLEFSGELHDPANSIGDMGTYKKLAFDVPAHPKTTDTMTLQLQGQPLLTLHYTAAKQWVGAPDAPITQLAPHEIRALGMGLRDDVRALFPYSRAARAGFDVAKHAPITDLHTHFSAQISAQDMFDTAFAADTDETPIAYPVELIELIAKGSTQKQQDKHQIIQVPARAFSPLRSEGLQCEQAKGDCEAIRLHDLTDVQRNAIINQMRVMPDSCIMPTDFDREMYRFRNPFAKHPALTKAMIRTQAEAYARMGVEYATLSTSSMLDPAWFAAMEEAVDEIEREGGVMVDGVRKPMHMRFLVGVPRNISPEETFVALNKIKFLARHPYIVGMDMNGYESTKTSHLFWALAHMGRWARDSHANPEEAPWDFKDKFIMQVHAGETSKNQDNVGRAIALARHYKTRVMIGHALHMQLSSNETRWLRELNSAEARAQDRFLMQMCQESNQAFMAKPLVHHSPITKRMQQAQCVQATDGGGALGSSPTSLAYAALAAGCTLDQLQAMQQYERGLIGRQLAREAKNRATFARVYEEGTKGSAAFLDAYKAHCAQFPDPAREKEKFETFLPPEFEDKKPLFIGGAAGSSWGKLDTLDQWEIEQFMDFLVATVDPRKTYFVLGRVQNEGVSKALDVAINRHNEKHPEAPFSVLGRVAEAPTGELAETITWLQPISGGRNDAAKNMVAFLRKQGGKALLFPGEDYTAEMITRANDHRGAAGRLASAFMVPRPNKTGSDMGKIYELAQVMDAETQFTSNHKLKPTQIGKENAAIDTFIDRMLQSGSPLIYDDADRANLLRDGVDLHAAKDAALAGWLKRHQAKVTDYIAGNARPARPSGGATRA